MHDDEIPISEQTVRRLVTTQFPQWTDRQICRVQSSGTVNAIFRIGHDLAARFPLRRRNAGVERETLEIEAKASIEFAHHSPFPCPTPVAIGEPGKGYPLPWSVQTWLSGTVAEDGTAANSTSFAHDLAT